MRSFSFHSLRAAALSGAVLGLLATGCARFEPARARQEQTDAFTGQLRQIEESELAAPLSLDDCIRIAMTNNYDARTADLNRQLYRIGKQVAFTAFLPNVAASAGYSSYSKDPEITGKRFGTASLDVSLPVFMPSSWFLYMAARHGYASADIAANYVRQGIVLQTTAAYFEVLVQQDTIDALETQLDAARELADRVQGLADEGLIVAWEAEQAQLIAELRENELRNARRQWTVLRAELLQTMGLSPLAPIEISGETGEINRPEGALEDLVLHTLEVHPQLSIADRQVVMQDHQVRQAFTAFLPVVSLFSTGSWTGNDLAAHSANWVSGFQGAWTLFDGLANVARYRAAKVDRTKTRLERERTFLSIMVGVIAAEAATQSAAEGVAVAQRAYDVAAAKSADYDAKADEGLIPLSDALDARVTKDFAQVQLVQSRYQEQITLANLELAMGITLVPETNPTETKE